MTRPAPTADPASAQAFQRPLKVCHLGKYYPPAAGGMETHLQTLARAQAALGAKVQVVCVNHEDRAGRDVTHRRFSRTTTTTTHDGPVKVTRVGRLASLAKLDLCPALLAVLRRACQEQPDVLHLHTPNPTMLLALAALRPAVPLVITHHSDVVRQRWLWYAVAPFEQQVYSAASLILTTSAAYAGGSAVLQRYLTKVRDLPLGIDLEPYLHPNAQALEHAAKLRQQHGTPLWLMVGRLIYYKGIDVALRALAHVPGKLLVIGTGPLQASLRQLARELGVADRVIWQGHASADELTGAYQAATALWFPSNARSEGFGLVQVEAMASGCPVINTAIPHSGVAWVSPHEEVGLTVPMNDPASLAAATQRLLQQHGLRELLSEQAKARVCEHFDQVAMGTRSMAHYAAALRTRPTAPAEAHVNACNLAASSR